MKYFVSVDGVKRKGPFSQEEIEAMLMDETIDGSTSIWRRGLDDWIPLAEVQEFENFIETLPPPLIQSELVTQKNIRINQEGEGFISPFIPSSFLLENRLAVILTICFFIIACAVDAPPLTSYVETAENNRVYLLKNPDYYGFWPFVEFSTETVVTAPVENNTSSATNATRQLYDQLHHDGLYTKSFEEFQDQFATAGSQQLLYEHLYNDNLYTKSLGDFQNQFFSTKSVGVQIETIRVFNGVFAGWNLFEFLIYFGILWIGIIKRQWRITAWLIGPILISAAQVMWFLSQWFLGDLLSEGLGYEVSFGGMFYWRQAVVGGLLTGVLLSSFFFGISVVVTRLLKRSRSFRRGLFFLVCVCVSFALFLKSASLLDDVTDKPRKELIDKLEDMSKRLPDWNP